MIESSPLFTRVPAALFGPLSGSHATLYWAILAVYYHYEFERKPFFLLRRVVVDTAEELVRESPIWRRVVPFTDQKKQGNYPSAVNGYKKWWGQKTLGWFSPPHTSYGQHGVEVIVNPELGLDVNGTRHLVKLYFKTDPLSKLRVDITIRPMETTLRPHCPKNEAMAVLDVRQAKLFTFQAAAAASMAMIDAELAYIASLWSHV